MQVSEMQRARILVAMARVVAEHGVGSATVARIVGRAGVSRRTFYDQFTGCEDCFLAVFEDTVARASTIATGAVAAAAPPSSSSGWREQVRIGLAALLVFFDQEPVLGSLLVVDALGAGPGILERRARVLEDLARIVDRGRSESKSGRGASFTSSSSSPPLTAEGVVGAVLSVVHARMFEQGSRSPTSGRSSARSRRASSGSMLELLNPLMGMIVLPYLGASAAQKELARPMPEAPRDYMTPSSRQRTNGNPLDGLNMRLTYRTLKVLSVIASAPEASNRQVADGAGIHDQGQISKLLTRLERLDLIHNNGAGQTHGEPNAWTLTPKGDEVQQALTPG